MQILTDPISIDKLTIIAQAMFGNLVKAVVDIEQGVIALDAPMHSDLEALLLSNGSKQSDLWGINLHPDQVNTQYFIEFDSVINLRPHEDNRSRGVESIAIRNRITKVVKSYIK